MLCGVAGAGDFVERGRGDTCAAWARALGGDGDVGPMGGIHRWGCEEWREGGGRGVAEDERELTVDSLKSKEKRR
jgi:hypothetical protein